MFGTRINLKDDGTRRSYGNKDVDLIAMADEVRIANEDLNEVGLALSALNKTAKDLEASAEFSKAVAQKDPALGSVVAHEMVSVALSNIGQEEMASEVVPAGEDIMVAEESIKDTMKNVWNKIKEYAKKTWEFIRNLIMKVVDFVKGIFGKEGSTGDELDKLLNKLKKDKKTVLDETEFPEQTAKRLVEKVSILALNDKKLTSDVYVKYIKLQAGLFDKADEAINKIKPEDISIDESKKTFLGVAVINGDKLTNLDALANAVWKLLTNSDKIKTNIDKSSVSDLDDLAQDYLDKYEINHLVPVGLTPNKVVVTHIGLKDEGAEAIKKGSSMELEDFKKFINNLEVSSIVIKPPKDEYEDKYENVVPLDYPSALAVATALKDNGKKATNKADKLSKAVDKKAKAVEKELGKILDKHITEPEAFSNLITASLTKVITLYTNAARELVKGSSDTLLSVARSTIGDIVKESARLYKKA